jgi:hypothetical protein
MYAYLEGAPVATLNYYTPVLYFFYPLTLGAGETVDMGIIYYTGMQTLSYVTVEGSTALNVPFIINESIVTVNGASEDAPPSDTTFLITVRNGDSEGPVEFGLQAWTVFS